MFKYKVSECSFNKLEPAVSYVETNSFNRWNYQFKPLKLLVSIIETDRLD